MRAQQILQHLRIDHAIGGRFAHGVTLGLSLGMSDSRYIDFISAYCDRWCERCAFTERCSLFAVQVAMAMCDDNEEEAMELAVGRAPSENGEPGEGEPGVAD